MALLPQGHIRPAVKPGTALLSLGIQQGHTGDSSTWFYTWSFQLLKPMFFCFRASLPWHLFSTVTPLVPLSCLPSIGCTLTFPSLPGGVWTNLPPIFYSLMALFSTRPQRNSPGLWAESEPSSPSLELSIQLALPWGLYPTRIKDAAGPCPKPS